MIVQLIVSIATFTKAFSNIFEEATTLYYSIKLKQAQDQSIEVAEEREKILSQISTPGISDDEKRKLRARLIGLSSL